jgi:glycosyltransferase involved in cell wall biosynthesis
MLAASTSAQPERCAGRVIFLIYSLCGAGSEKQVILIARMLVSHGYSAEIYTLAKDDDCTRISGLLEEAKREGVYFHRPAKTNRWLLSALIACRRSLRRSRDAALWSWGYRADLVATTIFRGLAPHISSLRSANAELIKQRMFVWRLINNNCARYISNSWRNVEQLGLVIPGVEKRCRVLYNAMETKALLQPALCLPEVLERLEVVMLGNIRIHTKGYDLAIETLRRAKAEGLPVRLRIAGLPVEAAQLRALIKQHDLASMCEYVGPVYDPFEFLRTGHLFLLFSRFEGMPNALFEAMAIGMPCIATTVGDVERLTQQNINTVQIGINDVDGALKAMRDALANWPRYRAIGAEARRLIQREFSTEAFERNLLDCLAGIITAPPA